MKFYGSKGLLREHGLELNEPMKIHCDNKVAISIGHYPVQHDRTKHVEVDQYFIEEKIEAWEITTPLVPIGQQLADVLTKVLSSTMFDFMVSNLGMHNMYVTT